ncbi:ABC transporter ATP-binding protein [Thalassotalea psychrophila]|uniref:ABC transporter ATP-binding protein n=1 Tax=Thalassotalea psychrophila TaxID=3065647 RepID=A0ABY9TW91_9GAMM|nr:ABC transporter ATP-binding protein [Colwelliaceae bacterium SQ149]
MSLLAINNLTCRYGNNTILNDLSLTVSDGEIMCLLGPSGCGKTTLLKAIAGLIATSSGEINLENTVLLADNVNDKSINVDANKRDLGMIFQDYALFPHLTIHANIAFGITHLSKTAQQNKISELLTLVNLDDLGDRYPHELSGGQQQRVAIARALAREPKVLLLDEPFSNIDAQLRLPLIKDIKAILKQRNMAAIFVTHAKEEAFALADTMALLNNGNIVQCGSPQYLYNYPAEKFVAEFLGHGSILTAQVLNKEKVRCVLGDITCTTNKTLITNETVELFVRPHQFSVIADETGNGVITEYQFRDDGYRAQVKVAEQNIEVWLPGYFDVESTKVVNVSLTPQQLVAF